MVNPKLRWSSSTAGIMACAVGGGIALGAIATGVSAHADGRSAVFGESARNLAPGDAVHGYFSVPAADQAYTPYLKALNLHDGCRIGLTCSSGGPKLSSTLQLAIEAPDGQTTRVSPAEITTATALPGGKLSAGSAPRRYAIAMTLPQTVTNGSESRTTSFDFQWGLMDAAGKPVTTVLGETVGRPPGSTSVLGQTISRGVLPFTGSDILVELIAACSLLACGGVLLAAARRRRGSRDA
jgi:hypothetical protein